MTLPGDLSSGISIDWFSTKSSKLVKFSKKPNEIEWALEKLACFAAIVQALEISSFSFDPKKTLASLSDKI